MACSLEYGTERFEELRDAHVIVLDEVSMISERVLARIHEVCVRVTGIHQPYGGKAMLLFGDFYQLPPVIKLKRQDQPIFLSRLFEKFSLFELKENCRQREDPAYADCLSRVRVGEPNKEDHELFRSRVCGKGHPLEDACTASSGLLTICSMRDDCAAINMAELRSLEGSIIEVKADDSRPITREEMRLLDPRDLLPPTLHLKPGARVILIRNVRKEEGLVNSLPGILTEIQPNFLRIDFEGIGEELIARFRQKISPPGFTPIIRRQFPISLAWAVTVHKVQGMTIPRVRVLMKGFFAEGQAYVAFSRVQKKEDLHLSEYDPAGIKYNPRIAGILGKKLQG